MVSIQMNTCMPQANKPWYEKFFDDSESKEEEEEEDQTYYISNIIDHELNKEVSLIILLFEINCFLTRNQAYNFICIINRK